MTASDILGWLIPWEFSPLLLICMGVPAAIYLQGCRNSPMPPLRQAYFWTGMALLYIVSHTKFDYYSEHAFFMHRIQHSILHHIGPFLIALSRPGAAFSAGAPPALKALFYRLMALQPIRKAVNFCNNPTIAALLFCGLILFWLMAPVHFIAMLDWRLYRVMNWGMALNGLMFWNLVLNNYCLLPADLSPAARIGIMLAIIPPQIVIGMLIFLTPRELYPIYTICGRVFNMTALADQQVGGLILWIPAAMMSVAGMLTVMRREWLK